jgi:predicted NUDIX family phosphoesterase
MEEELVLAVPTAGLWGLGEIQGVKVGGTAWLEYVFEPRHSRFLPRAAAEEDPTWKQIIPYVVLACDDKVFCYRRGQRSSETRLRTLRSVGLGGHIRHSDDSLFSVPGWPAYQAALQRELEEEVELQAPIRRQRLVGLINDDATPVGRVHLGLIHIFDLAEPRVRAREQKIAGAQFAPVAKLQTETDEFESWSALCLAAWPRLAPQSGWQPAG